MSGQKIIKGMQEAVVVAPYVATIERLKAALVHVRGFAAIMDETNWRDLRLHIERQCAALTPPDPEKRRGEV